MYEYLSRVKNYEPHPSDFSTYSSFGLNPISNQDPSGEFWSSNASHNRASKDFGKAALGVIGVGLTATFLASNPVGWAAALASFGLAGSVGTTTVYSTSGSMELMGNSNSAAEIRATAPIVANANPSMVAGIVAGDLMGLDSEASLNLGVKLGATQNFIDSSYRSFKAIEGLNNNLSSMSNISLGTASKTLKEVQVRAGLYNYGMYNYIRILTEPLNED